VSTSFRFLVLLLLFPVLSTKAFCQTSEQGIWLPTHGDLNVLVVYAEALNDPDYEAHPSTEWLPGQLPKQPDKYFDSVANRFSSGYISGYFETASYGAMAIHGISYPRLIQIDFGKAGYSNTLAITKALNEAAKSSGSLRRNLELFDRWTPKPNFEPKINQPDSLIDAIVVIWRVNSHISSVNNTGYCAPNNQNVSVLSFKGINCFSEFQSWDNNANVVLRHELSHAIYGGNNFHTGGAGAGTRTFIPSIGGYSMLSSWDSHSYGFNGWDRGRLGWKNPRKKFTTSAFKRTVSGLAEQEFKQRRPQSFSNGVYLMRDFVHSGDAVCLRMPGPDSPRLSQYLWLEYHTDTSRYDYPDTTRHGVYAYMQVGKDDKGNTYPNGSTSPGNYTFPLPASGRWDFVYYHDSTLNKNVLKKKYDTPNPIVGDHFLMRPLLDDNRDGVLEKLFIAEALIDGSKPITDHYMIFGNDDDAFKPGTQTRIGVATNPSTNTLVTYSYPHTRNASFNADTSFVTGLDIRIKDTLATIENAAERCALVAVRWNQFNIDNNVRWCGNIGLKPVGAVKPKLTVDSGCVLLLDRSLTPMQDKINKTDTLNGQLYFSPLTAFTLYKGTQLVLKKGATLKLEGNSTLYVRKGASLIFEDGSKLEAKNGSIVYVE